VLHELVSRHAQTLLAELRDADGRGLPRHVERELAEYLRCGILAHGFARVRCQACADEILVAFSCKRRGICPSCTARRMADTAAHLVDHVLPSAPYRQWVLSLPKLLRLRLARHPAWTTWIGGLIVRAIAAWQRRVARARHLAAPQTGAITFVQCACGGRRTVVAFVADANLTRSQLTSLGLPAEPATFAPARAPPQAELAWYDPA
jgi:hypothetical protein